MKKRVTLVFFHVLGLFVVMLFVNSCVEEELIVTAGDYTGIIAPKGPMAAPSNLAAVAYSAAVVKLNWNDNSEAETAFKIERSVDKVTWTIVGEVAPNVKIFENAGLTPETKYYYRVRAVNATIASEYSNIVYATTLAANASGTLAAPTNLVATSYFGTVARLTWTDNSEVEKGFQIERTVDKITWTIVGAVEANVKVFENTELTPGTKYYYRVRAVNGSSYSEYSNLAYPVAPVGSLAAPSNLTAVAYSASLVKLTWTDNSESETNFKIERSFDNVTWTLVGAVDPNVKVFENSGLTAGTKYYYRVRAINATSASEYSNVVYTTTLATNPSGAMAAPTNLVVAATSGTVVKLTWTDNSEAEKGFEIERTVDKVTWTVVGAVEANVKVFENTGLTPGTKYYYRVRAVNGSSYSEYSNLAYPSTSVGSLAAPSNLTAVANSASVVKLTWTDNSESETNFKIERSFDSVTWTLVGAVDSNVKVFEDSGLIAGTRYYYRVRAINATSTSDYSAVVKVTTLTVAMVAPSNLAGTASSATAVRLTWTDNSDGELGFLIEKSTDNLNWSQIGSTAANVKVFEFSGLTGATKYYFRVRAKGPSGYSDYTASISIVTL